MKTDSQFRRLSTECDVINTTKPGFDEGDAKRNYILTNITQRMTPNKAQFC